ncbi:MAG: 2-oxoglutarate dehydrogenase complex dihydrolipoyllysine-residue succinyltransferase [Planctomycetes bacterium]|nr:2-oxoglutarate dehydrogenase complex dihydrolipoyllysine-residue succinyltransferase [Planctomycetota bacterium]
MIIDVRVPEAGESITEGVLLEWHKQTGEPVHADEPLFELETDKITMSVAAPADGELTIGVGAGERVVMGQVVATIDTARRVAAAAVAPERGAATELSAEPVRLRAEARPAAAASSTLEEQPPSVRRMLLEHGLDPGAVVATGKAGRLTKEDVVRALEAGKVAPAPATPPAPVTPPAAPPAPATEAGPSRQTRRPMTPIRKRIAERLVASRQTAAILTTFNEADMSAVQALRARYRERFEQEHGVRLGLLSFFVNAVVDALRAVPALNAQIDGDEIVQNHFFDIGVAIGTEHGLVVPVLRDADRLSFGEIERRIADFARRARERKLELGELEGGCYTLSNGGVYGSLLSTPLLNPPQSGILGLHAIKKRPVVVDDRVEIRPMMYLAQSYDHRLIDGAEAVAFLRRVVECVEEPERMWLDI